MNPPSFGSGHCNLYTMNEIELLTKQTEDAYDWTNKVLTDIPYDKWDIIPPVVESSISWQVGHLILSFYFHAVSSVIGHRKDILAAIPMKVYSGMFVGAAPALSQGKTDPQELFQQLKFMEQRSLEVIRSLTPEDLDTPLAPISTPHPIATNKYEAIDWNIKHTMWHTGQLGLLKRIVHERYDFGLKKAD